MLIGLAVELRPVYLSLKPVFAVLKVGLGLFIGYFVGVKIKIQMHLDLMMVLLFGNSAPRLPIPNLKMHLIPEPQNA